MKLRSDAIRGHYLPAIWAVWVVLYLSACATAPIPLAESLSRQELVRLSKSLSEDPGYFDSDNLITNESSYLHVLDKLHELPVAGGVYLGVGPEQNFTYIANIKPSLAIIVDIRRDNLLQHLWYKALFETSPTRSEFLSQMIGRPIPPEWEESPNTDVNELVKLFQRAADSEEYYSHVREKLRRQIQGFGFPLERRDWEFIAKVEQAFHQDGLELRFSSFRRQWQRRYPTLKDILLEKDLQGKRRIFLNNDADYQYLRRLQLANKVVPVTGDLAGSYALKAIGSYARKAGKTISAFYVSNVEFYLFRNRAFGVFMENVEALPIGPNSVFIRSYFNYTYPHPEQMPGYLVTSSLQRIRDLVGAHKNAQIRTYWDVVTTRFVPLLPQ